MIADRTSLVNSVDFAKGGGVVPTVVCDAVSGQAADARILNA